MFLFSRSRSSSVRFSFLSRALGGNTRRNTNPRLSGNPQKATRGMALGLITSLATLLLLSNHSLGWNLEHDTLDFWFSLRHEISPPAPQSRDVAVLAIDEATVRRWQGRIFDARDVGKLLQLLRNEGVATAALTLPALTDNQLHLPDEAQLARDIRSSEVACLPLNFIALRIGSTKEKIAASKITENQTIENAIRRFSVALPPGTPLSTHNLKNGVTTRLQTPPLPFLRGAVGAGHIAFTLDSDGRVRRIPLLIEHEGKLYPPLSLAAARITALQRANATTGDAQKIPNSTQIPLLPNGTMLLNFPQSKNDFLSDSESAPTTNFRTVSVAAALENKQLLHGLKGRCVVIGPTASGITSMFSTPGGARLPATMLHAIAIDNILTEQVVERAPNLFIWLLTILLCVTIGGFVTSRPPLWSGVVVLLSLAAIAFLSLGLFVQNIWLDISLPWLAGALTFLSGVIGRARRQERESTRIGSTIDALGRVSEIIATQTQSQQLLDRVLGWATSVMKAEGSSALLLDESGEVLHFAAANGPKSQELKPFTVKMGEGIAGWVAKHGKPAIVNDVRHDARFNHSIADAIDFPTQAILCVPLRVRDKMMGVIEVINRLDGSPFNEDDAELLSAVANQAALVLENSKLYEMLSERVVRSESDLEITNHRLQAEKTTLQTILQSMTDGVVVTDNIGLVQMVNPAAAALLPELSHNAVGLPLEELLPDVALAARDLLQTSSTQTPPILSTHKEAKHAVQLQRGDIDTPRFIEAHSAPLQGDNGVLAGVVSVFADVTEARGIEQAKSDFVSFVAHEMRSPLTSISGFSSMLQKQEQSTEQKAAPNSSRARFLGIIYNESERLTRLINNLLDVARIEAGHGIEIHPAAIDFKSIAEEAVESQRAYSSRHQFHLRVAPDLPPCFADRDKVVQILINLISNALKYSSGGNVTVAATRDDNFLQISVSDQGPGISEEQRARLFQRFGRAPSRSVGSGERAKPTGTGLGLFLTRHLVESHGGRIWAQSEPGQGTTFIFTLPIAPQEEKSVER